MAVSESVVDTAGTAAVVRRTTIVGDLRAGVGVRRPTRNSRYQAAS